MRKEAFLQIMGSRDRFGRQLNGMGAGISSLSKVCIVSPSSGREKEGDVNYTFVGVGIEGDETDYAGNCGNLSAAIGPYAFNERILPNLKAEDYEKTTDVSVDIYNTNTKVIIRSKFHVEGGQARVDDLVTIDGVSGLGTGVKLDFMRPGGSKTGKLLPTGNTVDRIADIEVSCVDSANPCIFIRAADIDLDPTVSPTTLAAQKDTLSMLERIRQQGAVLMGLCTADQRPPRVIPKIGIVHPPMDQVSLSGEVIPAREVDLVVRFISDAQPHRAIPLTGALCTATAAKIQGSVVEQCLGAKKAQDDVITIAHPSGKIQVEAKIDTAGEVESASVVRSARRLMDGKVYWNPPS